MKLHYIIRIQGLVQNVNFRIGAYRLAEELDITGFVRNERDGSLYIEAEGAEEVLRQFIDWCNKGPDSAHVTGVRVRQESRLQQFKRFEIVR